MVQLGKSLISGSSLIPHPGIQFWLSHHFQPDGIHLSVVGTDILLTDLQVGLHYLLEVQLAGGKLSQD